MLLLITELQPFLFRDMRNIDTGELEIRLVQSNWDSLYNQHDINDMVDRFNNNVLGVINELAPLQSVTSRRQHVPWITRELRCEMRRRNGLHKLFVRTKLRAVYVEYRLQLQNLVQSRIRSARGPTILISLLPSLDQNKCGRS